MVAAGLGAPQNEQQLLVLGAERRVCLAHLLLALGGGAEEGLELSNAVVFALAVGALGFSVGGSPALWVVFYVSQSCLWKRFGKRVANVEFRV